MITFFSFRSALFLGLCAAIPACSAPPETEDPEPEDPDSFEDLVEKASIDVALSVVEIAGEAVSGDVAHYTVVVRLGDSPGAEIAIHRVVRELSPGFPRKAASAVMLLHGDFATFPSNFLPPSAGDDGPASHGLAGYLAARDIDVWGIDRRWTRTPADATDLSGYATMGLAEEIDDMERALAFARAVRALGGEGEDQVILGGFSHGAQIAYEYAGVESQRSAGERHVKGIVPIDIYDRIAPEDEALRLAACESRDYNQSLLDSGELVVENSFFAQVGELAQSQPDEPSPIFDGYTNREVLLGFLGQTWMFYAPVPDYHLAGGVLSGESVTSMRYSPELRLQRWLGAAPPFQSTLESLELDAIWCGEEPRPLPDHLADIQVPLFYLGAAGGFGANGLHTTEIVGSSDVTTLVLSKQDEGHRSEDLGHGDLLYGDEVPDLAWEPLATWITSH